MDQNRRLLENLKKVNPQRLTVYQGIVTGVNGIQCSCRIGNAVVTGIKLRASLTDRERQMLVVPKSGSAVVLGSLSGDLANLVVLQADEVEKIVINGGSLGGLVNIEDLTAKINGLVDAFNSHTHTLPVGTVSVTGSAGPSANPSPVTVPAVTTKADKFSKEDYEDNTVVH